MPTPPALGLRVSLGLAGVLVAFVIAE